MGRNCWRKMTSHRGSKRQKMHHKRTREEFQMLDGKKDVMEFIEGDMKYDTQDDVQVAKRLKTDVVIARDNGSMKENISEPENCEKENFLSGIQLPVAARESRPGAIFVFENASLVLAKINKSYQILNPDEHAGFIKKHKLNRSDYRPDIIHEVLANLFRSTLNLTGGIQAVYVKTIQGHLIKIEPTISFPKTLKKFCAMMSQFLQKMSIKGSGRSKCRRLLRMVKNPVTDHLPVGSHKIGLSSTSVKAAENMREYFDTIGSDRPLVFVIGAMAHGKIDAEYIDDFIAVSRKPLSANICVRRIWLALGKQQRIN